MAHYPSPCYPTRPNLPVSTHHPTRWSFHAAPTLVLPHYTHTPTPLASTSHRPPYTSLLKLPPMLRRWKVGTFRPGVTLGYHYSTDPRTKARSLLSNPGMSGWTKTTTCRKRW